MRRYYYQLISRSLLCQKSHFLGFRRSNLVESRFPECTHLHTIRGFSSSPQESTSEAVVSSDRVSGIVDELMNLSLLEMADLTEVMKKIPGINDMPVMPVMIPGKGMGLGLGMGLKSGLKKGAGGGAAKGKAEEKAADKTAFDLKLEAGFDAGSKIKIIKEVRSFTDMGLKEAKELVEKAPTLLKKGVSKEEAEKIIEKMKEIGAKVVME